MRKRVYKVFELVHCVVSEPCECDSKKDGKYHVRKVGSELAGVLICGKRQLSIGEELICQVGDSDENGDHMVLIMD
jgi:hypothetical protein